MSGGRRRWEEREATWPWSGGKGARLEREAGETLRSERLLLLWRGRERRRRSEPGGRRRPRAGRATLRREDWTAYPSVVCK